MLDAKLAPIRLDIDPRLGVRYKYPSLEPIRRLTGGGIMKFPHACLPPTPWGQLPPLLRLLLISPFEETGCWLRSALADDQAIEIVLVEVSNLADGLARLREEPFDTVLLDHDPEALDALVAIDTIRTGTSAEQSIVVLGTLPVQEMAALCFESAADTYLHLPSTTTRAFLWHLSRAAERQRLLQENQRLNRFRTNCHQLEREEAHRLLQQHREILGSVESELDSSLAVDGDSSPVEGSSRGILAERYRELLQAYVIMGSNGLADEIERWIEMAMELRWSPRQMLAIHWNVAEQMIQELGCRSSRHLMNRANVLATHILLRYTERVAVNSLEAERFA